MKLTPQVKLITNALETVSTMVGFIKPKTKSLPDELLEAAERRIKERIDKP